MGMFLTMALPVLIVSIAFAVYYIVKRRRPKSKITDQAKGKDKAKEDSEPNALVQDVFAQAEGLEHLTENVVNRLRSAGSLGRRWDYEGKKVYWLQRAKGGSLKPVIPPVDMTHSPYEIWCAIHQPETEIFFDVSSEKSAFAKYGPYIAVFAISIFALVVRMGN